MKSCLGKTLVLLAELSLFLTSFEFVIQRIPTRSGYKKRDGGREKEKNEFVAAICDKEALGGVDGQKP